MGLLKIHKIMAITVAALFMVCSMPELPAHARAKNGHQRRIKVTQPQLQALFIKKITKYVLGPDKRRVTAERPVTVATIAPKKLSRFFRKPDKFKLVRWPDEESKVLFVDVDNPRIIAAVLKKVKGKPILTIGQSPDFLRLGGMINLVESGSRFKLQVNICAARKAGLTISSKLLKLSEIYCGDTPQ
ncbi:YfiR family protein [Desulfovibrio sp. JC022]|uniref:YfiR family protein n=1 Tax=Desulfovibrio sp. JC022 TaxID=2593642 RepID=UPI0013D2C10C|nr:YfiR family protein [Desulfovibrio sp. JC022]NDV21379.1 YfiR family protein [Desulfovibrio sp. JC022]